MGIVKNIAAIAKGMSITFGEMFKPTEVENYPDGPGPNRGAMFQERFRGMHVLQRDENGLEKCVACFLCAAACPSNCIYIEAAENYRDQPHQRRRALRQGLQHRLQPLHLLRLLRRGLPHRRHHPRTRLRVGQLQRQHSGIPQRAVAGRDSGARRIERHLQHRRNRQAGSQARAIQFRGGCSARNLVITFVITRLFFATNGRDRNRGHLHLTVHSLHFADHLHRSPLAGHKYRNH